MAKIRLKDGLGEVKLKYLVRDTDRHGNVRYYVRRPGQRKIRLWLEPGTPEFIEEYWRAVNNKTVSPPRASKRVSTEKGSIRWLCLQYYNSPQFNDLSERTRNVRKRILDQICEREGDKPYAKMEPRNVRKRRDDHADRPEAANAKVKALRQLFNFAVEYELAQTNPAKKVPYLKSWTAGFHSWSREDIDAFEQRHPIGSKARLALALLLHTGLRRSDVVRLGPQHVKNGWITIKQAKNRKRKPVELKVPVLPELQQVIDQTQTGNLSFLVTEFGKPFTPDGFGNWFRKRFR